MKYNLSQLKHHAKSVRRNILTMSFHARSAHTGGSLSCVEILITLYFNIMKVYPNNPYDKNRDRLIFSKAHDAKALYATLAERGFFSKKILEKYEVDDGMLAGHTIRHAVPGIEASAGSLGHGLPIACGVSYAGRMSNKKFRVFCVMSDGECDEGSVWEAAMFAGHHGLSNLIVIVDYNKLQGFGFTKDILNLEPFAKKWEAFGWNVKEVDGHNISKLISVISSVAFNSKKPSVILAHTIKGKGGPDQHINQISSQYCPPSEDEYEKVMHMLNT